MGRGVKVLDVICAGMGSVTVCMLDAPLFNSRYSPICPGPPVSLADPGGVKAAVETLKAAERPLVIIGKGTNMSAGTREGRIYLWADKGSGLNAIDNPLSMILAWY